jgi:hypothetical protein
MNAAESALLTLLSGEMVPSNGFPSLPWSLEWEDEGDGKCAIRTVIRNYGRPTLKLVVTRTASPRSAIILTIATHGRDDSLVTVVPEILELFAHRYIVARHRRDEQAMHAHLHDLEMAASGMRLANGGAS